MESLVVRVAYKHISFHFNYPNSFFNHSRSLFCVCLLQDALGLFAQCQASDMGLGSKRFSDAGLPPISLFICSDNNLKTQMRGDEVLVR